MGTLSLSIVPPLHALTSQLSVCVHFHTCGDMLTRLWVLQAIVSSALAAQGGAHPFLIVPTYVASLSVGYDEGDGTKADAAVSQPSPAHVLVRQSGSPLISVVLFHRRW